MEKRKHVVGSRVIDGKLIQVCRWFFIHPERENIMGNTQRSFTKEQRKEAKRKYKEFKERNPFAHEDERAKVVADIVSSKPRFEVKLKLI